ncbi:unnamed protein product, partial [Tuber aestivum]
MGMLGTRSAFLMERFERLGDSKDMESATGIHEEIMRRTRTGDQVRTRALANLGTVLCRKFEQTGNLGDLQQAIKHTEEALDATYVDHPDRAITQSNLGAMYLRRFEQMGDLGDLQKAINHSEEALAAIPQDHPKRAGIHSNLGTWLSKRFERIGDFGDLQEAIKHTEEALAAAPHDYRERAILHYNLGSIFLSRFQQIGDLGDLKKSITHAKEQNNLGIRLFESFEQIGDLRDLQKAIKHCKEALGATPNNHPERADRHSNLGNMLFVRFGQIGDLGDLQKAIEHLEEALAATPKDHPKRATGYTLLGILLESRFKRLHSAEDLNKSLRLYHDAHEFRTSPPRERVKAARRAVVFNSTVYRSDAIIATTSAIASLELPKLKYEETGHWMRQLASFGQGGLLEWARENKVMKDLLVWLWDAAVGPVFDYLESRGILISGGAHDNDLKRIWWIGVGQLGMAPLHAAGDHSRGSTRNTLSRAISTYIPTIKALSYARQTQLQLFDKYGSSFSTEHSKKSRTPIKRNLLRYILSSAAKSSIEPTVLRTPTPAKVLKQVQHHGIVHFACHGVSEFNPSDNHLVLFSQDGNKTDRLLARDISKLVAQNAQIAYLSACSSAKNPSVELADEVIHLASAFQLAGFSHTFANMWETNDYAACEVARDFYDLLFQNRGNGGDDHQRVSTAFYKAVKKVRDRSPGCPLVWAPFMHTSA